MLSKFLKRRKIAIKMLVKLRIIIAIKKITMQIPVPSQKTSVNFNNFCNGD